MRKEIFQAFIGMIDSSLIQAFPPMKELGGEKELRAGCDSGCRSMLLLPLLVKILLIHLNDWHLVPAIGFGVFQIRHTGKIVGIFVIKVSGAQQLPDMGI